MKDNLKKLIFIISILIIWQIIHSFFNIKSYILPSPIELSQTFLKVFAEKEIFIHILNSLQRIIIGFMFGLIFGVGLAIISGYFKKIGFYIKPIIELFRPIPPIAWIPVAILLFGLGNTSSYFIVFLGAFFPIFSNTYFGVLSMPKIYQNISKTFELTNYQYITKVLFYYCLPNIFIGAKIGIGMAWMSVIAAELIGAQSGLGYYIQINRLLLNVDKILVGMIFIGVIGFILNLIITKIEKIVLKWKY